MAALATTGITLPRNVASGMFIKATTGSAVAVLAADEPMQFGVVDIMTFTSRPKAEYVGEGAQKAPTDVGFGVKTATPHKVHVTMRFNARRCRWRGARPRPRPRRVPRHQPAVRRCDRLDRRW